jgi:hypothetical protein
MVTTTHRKHESFDKTPLCTIEAAGAGCALVIGNVGFFPGFFHAASATLQALVAQGQVQLAIYKELYHVCGKPCSALVVLCMTWCWHTCFQNIVLTCPHMLAPADPAAVHEATFGPGIWHWPAARACVLKMCALSPSCRGRTVPELCL